MAAKTSSALCESASALNGGAPRPVRSGQGSVRWGRTCPLFQVPFRVDEGPRSRRSRTSSGRHSRPFISSSLSSLNTSRRKAFGVPLQSRLQTQTPTTPRIKRSTPKVHPSCQPISLRPLGLHLTIKALSQIRLTTAATPFLS